MTPIKNKATPLCAHCFRSFELAMIENTVKMLKNDTMDEILICPHCGGHNKVYSQEERVKYVYTERL